MQMLSELFGMAVAYPNRAIGLLITIVGCIDYACGNDPDSVRDKYIGLTRRILYQIRKLVREDKK
jgi:hypothetical protein